MSGGEEGRGCGGKNRGWCSRKDGGGGDYSRGGCDHQRLAAYNRVKTIEGVSSVVDNPSRTVRVYN